MLHPRWILGFWLTGVLSLCGADDTCQTVLTLDPPEVAGELGDNLEVNCTSSEEIHDGIFWTYSGTESDNEEDKNYKLLILSLSEWNLSAKCTIKLNETFECSKDLKITIYKVPTLELSFPRPMIEGNDYELKCDIKNVTPVQNLRVNWYRGNTTLRTQTFDDASVTPTTVVSTLNITADRRLNGEGYSCKTELDVGPVDPEFLPSMPTATEALDIQYPPIIHDCPEEVTAVEHKHSMNTFPCYAHGNPAVTLQWYHEGTVINASETLTRGRSGTYMAVAENELGRSETSVKVKVEYAPELWDHVEELSVDEGANVSLACEVDGIPLFFNWTCDGQNMNVSASVLNVTHVTTNRSCTCMAHNYLGVASKSIRLHVVTPEPPSVPSAVATPETVADTGCPLMLSPAEVTVRFGDPVRINCTSLAPAVLAIFWQATTGEAGHVGQAEDTVATWSVQQMTEWSAVAECTVHLGHMHCSKKPNITLYKTPDNVFVRIPDQMVEGVDYQLVCHIIRVAPVQNLKVKWYHGSEVVEVHTFNDTATAPVNVSSVLKVSDERGHNGERFSCEAELDLGPNGPQPVLRVLAEAPYPAVVHWEPDRPVFRECPEHFSGLENMFSLDMLPCDLDGNPAATVQWYHEGRVVNASEPLSRTRSGMYMARAENSNGTSTIWVKINIEYGPSLSCGPSYEVEENDVLQTVCEPDGMPPPVVAWIRDGKEMESSHLWKKDDRGNYLLRATNAHGTADHELYLDVLYAPLFSKGNSTVEVTPGHNVTLECFAEANPSPEIQWIFHAAANVMNTTEWRRSVLTVTKATSTNAGVYTCVATNKIGRATRFDTLRMKDQTRTFLPEVFWALLILLVAVIIIGLIMCYMACKNRKKHGQYAFVRSTSKNDSERSYPFTEVPQWMQA